MRLERIDAVRSPVYLEVTAKVLRAYQQAFETAANNAKAGCPVSKALNGQITMEAKLEA